ncbi:MAG: YihY/virulence factor BrkB family protein [Isosphaeraceae bacterium]
MLMRWRCLGGLGVVELGRKVWARASAEDFATRAAAAAYYGLTATVPFLGLLVSLAANLVPGPGDPKTPGDSTWSEVLEEVPRLAGQLMPEEAVTVVGRELTRIREAPPVKLLSVGLVLALWFSSGVFGVLIDALNRIQGVPETRPPWRVWLTAAGLTLLEAVIMLGTLASLVVVPVLRRALGWGDGPSVLSLLGEWAPVTLGVLLSFAVTARLGPACPPRWRWITPGSAFGTAVFLAAASLLRLYVANWGNYANTYGSLAGVLLLTTWFWIVALIVLVAFQVDKIIDDECGVQR